MCIRYLDRKIYMKLKDMFYVVRYDAPSTAPSVQPDAGRG